jgi:hypothetical protein
VRRAGSGLLCALALVAVMAMPSGARAGDRGWDQITRSLKNEYGAKRHGRFATWLGSAVVKFAKPEGVKGIKIALFRELDVARDPRGTRLDDIVRAGLGTDWSRIVQVSSRGGERTLVYAKWHKEDVELMVVAIEREEATVVRVIIDPEQLGQFVADNRFRRD